MRPRRDVALALVTFCCVLGLAFDGGGFFERSWTIAAVALLWVVALALLLVERLEVSPTESVWVVLLASFVGWTALSLTWSTDPQLSLLEVRRGVVYVSGAAALVLLATGRSRVSVVVAVWSAVVVVILYALGRYLLEPTFRDIHQG